MRTSKSRVFAWILGACALMIGAAAVHAGYGYGYGGPSYLVITRAPDLGNNVFVDVRIDGMRAGGILWAQKDERPIASGRHVIRVQLGPAQYTYLPSSIEVNVHSGRTYYFQAKKQGRSLVLARYLKPLSS